MKIYTRLFVLLLLSNFLFFACSREKSSQQSTLKIKMTDNPADWDEVNVDIREVRVNYKDDSSGWVTLPTNAGIYDLLQLQNGVDTVIAQGVVSSSRVKEIRLLLGDNNSIVVNGQTHPLTIPSGGSSGLKIKLHKNLSRLDSVLIDFDAALSVKEENGSYKLRPVIKIK